MTHGGWRSSSLLIRMGTHSLPSLSHRLADKMATVSLIHNLNLLLLQQPSPMTRLNWGEGLC